jgi:hypothetical protein
MGKLGKSTQPRAVQARSQRSRALKRAALGLVPLALLAAGCGSGGDDTASLGGQADETTLPPTTLLPSCAENRHIVVFDYFGFLTQSDDDLRQWLDDPTDTPDLRLGALETVTAYRSLGYEIAYLNTVPVNMAIGDQPIDDAIRGWLESNDFPLGEGTTILGWQSGDAIIGITNQLLDFQSDGVSVDAGYTDNQDKAAGMITGGVPADHMYTVGTAAGTEGSRAIPDDDVIAHSANIADLPKVCEASATGG